MRVGLDIGGTKTAGVLLRPDGVVAHEIVLPTGHGPSEVLATARHAVDRLTEDAGISAADLSSIGIGIPGVIDRRGVVSHAVNLGLHEFDLRERLSSLSGVRVEVENDVNAAALGVYRTLVDPAVTSMAYLNLGTGLAAGLVLGGQLWRGARGTAGEIGHVPVDPDGPLCACGQRGCLELSASGAAVAREWASDHSRPVESLFEAADRGDARAVEVRSRLVRNIAAAVRMLVLTVDVESVVIGGGMSSLGDPLLDAVRHVLDGWGEDSPFMKSLELSARVRVVPVTSPFAALGAAFIGAADEEYRWPR